jgi:phytanoyl-CoA hydroxylase
MNTIFSHKDIDGIKQFYQENGYVTIYDMFDDEEVNTLRLAFNEAVEKGDITVNPEAMVECNDAIYKHSIYEKYAKDERIVSLTQILLGREGLELQHSKINSKPMADKGKGIIQWHQDYPFFPHTNFDLLAVGIHLDDEDLDSGPLMVVPRSHKLGVLSHCNSNKFAYECTDKEALNSGQPIPICCKSGYVTIHHCLTLHFSDQKKNNKSRRLLVYQYRALDNIQMAGVIWKCTGLSIKEGKDKGYARFADGSIVEMRGVDGRLYDKFAKLAPDTKTSSNY